MIKNGDFVLHRSPGNAPYITIGRVLSGGNGSASHLRIHPVMRVFGFGSSREDWKHADLSDSGEVVPAEECQFLYEDTRPKSQRT